MFSTTMAKIRDEDLMRQVDEIMEIYDFDLNGYITYQEFLIGTKKNS